MKRLLLPLVSILLSGCGEDSSNAPASEAPSSSSGFTLDEITLELNSTDSLKITNHTPKLVDNPIVKVDGQYIKVNKSLAAYSSITLDLPIDQSSQVEFMNELPFFKVSVTGFSSDGADYPLPNAYNIDQYEQEIVALKNISNNATYVEFLAKYLDSYNSSRSSSHTHHENCGHTDETFTQLNANSSYSVASNDTDTLTNKLFSYLMYEPESEYHMLSQSRPVAGVATIGEGWLSVRQDYLHPEGGVVNRNYATYLHEKMHNHGFNHSGGLTSGLDTEIANFVSGHWQNYYNDQYQTENQRLIYAEANSQVAGNSVYTEFKFMDKNFGEAETVTLDRFMVLVNSSTSIEEVGLIDTDGLKTPISLDEEIGADHQIHIYKSWGAISPVALNATSSTRLYVKTTLPTETNQGLILMATSSANKYVQASAYQRLEKSYGFIGETLGYQITNSDFALYNYQTQLSADNKFVKVYRTYTPNQAKLLCQESGMSLSRFSSDKSEMMDRQMNYMPYRSQVALYDDVEKAYSVPTSYRPSLIKEVDNGELVFCSVP